MPVPNLRTTCQKLLEWSTPLLTKEERALTEKEIENFLREGGDGQLLQGALVKWQQQNPDTNWAAPVWKAIYLDSRDSLAINSNVFYYLKSKLDEDLYSQAYIASALIFSVYQFISLIDKQELSVDRQGEIALCMNQYKNIFSSMRIPCLESDEFYVSSQRQYIVVMHKENLYRVDILDKNGEIRSIAAIQSNFECILKNEISGQGIGILTTIPRNEWATTRTELSNFSTNNQNIMTQIQDAALVLCLDENCPQELPELSQHLLYGDGKDRFFDKSLQLVVFKNGKMGINFEHTSVDGSAMLRLIGYIYDYIDSNAFGVSDNAQAQKLDFDLNAEFGKKIQDAKHAFVKHAQNTQIRVLDFEEFGKNQIKTFGVSPDAFVQLALQLAEHKLYDKCYSAYEAVMTRTFLDGRIDVLYTVTPESVDFIEKMRDANCSQKSKIDALVNATQKHIERAKECRLGEGVYSHLFALKYHYNIAGNELGIKQLPTIFTDRGFQALTHSVVCTSTTAKYGVELAGYGPIVDDGYGIRYFTRNNRIRFNMTSRTKMQSELEKMHFYIRESLQEMAELMRCRK